MILSALMYLVEWFSFCSLTDCLTRVPKCHPDCAWWALAPDLELLGIGLEKVVEGDGTCIVSFLSMLSFKSSFVS